MRKRSIERTKRCPTSKLFDAFETKEWLREKKFKVGRSSRTLEYVSSVSTPKEGKEKPVENNFDNGIALAAISRTQ